MILISLVHTIHNFQHGKIGGLLCHGCQTPIAGPAPLVTGYSSHIFLNSLPHGHDRSTHRHIDTPIMTDSSRTDLSSIGHTHTPWRQTITIAPRCTIDWPHHDLNFMNRTSQETAACARLSYACRRDPQPTRPPSGVLTCTPTSWSVTFQQTNRLNRLICSIIACSPDCAPCNFFSNLANTISCSPTAC